MIGVYTILLLGCSGAVLGIAPPYVQSSEAFSYAKTFLAEKLPNRKMDIHNIGDRPHISFSMLVGVTTGLALLQDDVVPLKSPLEVVDLFVPLIWNKYDHVSKQALIAIDDANQKVALIIDLLNNACGAVDVEECNAQIARRVKNSPSIYKLPADLLLSLGTLSAVIRDNESTINSIIQRDNDIPYLINNVEKQKFSSLVILLQIIYGQMNELTYRRSLSES